MIISPFNSIFFLKRHKHNGLPCPYTQVFSTEDEVMLQTIRAASESSVVAVLVNAETGVDVKNLPCNTYSMKDGAQVDCYKMSSVPPGFYFISIDGEESETFRITDDADLIEDTVLIEYSAANNHSRRDVLGENEENFLYFTFRVPGGFKDSGWDFSIDNEQFVTPESDIVELYGRESIQKTLTVGHSQGVPIWFGDLVNRLLTCRYVYIDGGRYARFESSVPEKEQTMDGMSSFVFSQKLQRINYLEPDKQ